MKISMLWHESRDGNRCQRGQGQQVLVVGRFHQPPLLVLSHRQLTRVENVHWHTYDRLQTSRHNYNKDQVLDALVIGIG